VNPTVGTISPPTRGWILLLAGIGLLAFILRWYYVTHAIVDTPVRGDAIEYYCYAWNLIHHGVFSLARPDAAQVVSDSFRDPGYPVFLAAWIGALGAFAEWYPRLLIGQALLGAVTVVLLMSAARHWLPTRWIAGTGVLMAIWPHSITIAGYILSETLFGFLCALALCMLGVALRRSRTWSMAVAGLLFGVAALTNAVAIPLAPVLALLLWLHKLVPARMSAALALAALLLPFAWGLRSAHVDGASSGRRAAMNLVQGSWPEYHGSLYRNAMYQDAQAKRNLERIGGEYQLFRESPSKGLGAMARRMSTEPGRYILWYLGKPMLLWDWSIRVGVGDIYVYPTPYSPFYDQPLLRVLVALCHALNPLLMPLMLVGCIAIWLRRRQINAMAMVMLGTAVFVTAIYSVLQAEPRYSIPFRGIELLLAAYGVWQAVGFALARRTTVQTGAA
jgi:4-amino-4-deoxy-L-arabinose transferase-like glycosyltransferase